MKERPEKCSNIYLDQGTSLSMTILLQFTEKT